MALGVPVGTLEVWADQIKEDPSLVERMAEDIDGLIEFIKALHNTARFP